MNKLKRFDGKKLEVGRLYEPEQKKAIKYIKEK
jgi:hypothetical protein